jgi:hypothetical protein
VSLAPEFLVVAISGRAIAAAAARAGRRVAVIDLFADDDTRRLATSVLRVAGDPLAGFDPAALARAVARFPGLPLVPGTGFEGNPALLGRIARGRRLLGTPPAALRALKDPLGFARLLARLGVPHPETRPAAPRDTDGWLMRRSGGWGGLHVRHAARAAPAAGVYYQRFHPGRAVGVAFVADGSHARVIDLSEQWAAPARGAPFRYGGAVAPARLAPATARRLTDAAETAAGAGGAVGLGSADFLVAEDESFVLLEINPRPGATLDLLDRRDPPRAGTALALHLAACNGNLPAARRGSGGPAMAAAVVYVDRRARIPPKIRWPAGAADLSPAGTRLVRGAPVCTVTAQGATPAHARAAVGRKALAVLARLDYA